MLTYLDKRIGELECDQLSAMKKGDVHSATQYSFAICELMDAKAEYIKWVQSGVNKSGL